MNNTTNLISLKEQWDDLKKNDPTLRIRNAADILQVSEVELLVTQCGENVTRLSPEFEKILLHIESLGKVMALTRNNEVVHERKGIYLNAEFNKHVGLFVGKDIDLRIFITQWNSAFAVSEPLKDGFRKSLQFFGSDGEAIHKIYMLEESNNDEYDKIVSTYTDADQHKSQIVTPKATVEQGADVLDNEMKSFQQEWRDLKDTHDFFGLIKKYKITRLQALEMAPDQFATNLDLSALHEVLNIAALKNIPIMIFVGNKGMIQIHTGTVNKIVLHGPWLNVLDPDFNLHIKTSGLNQVWLVKKPTTDGIVTSIEVFNHAEELIVQIFGERKPGIPELEEWREIVSQLKPYTN